MTTPSDEKSELPAGQPVGNDDQAVAPQGPAAGETAAGAGVGDGSLAHEASDDEPSEDAEDAADAVPGDDGAPDEEMMAVATAGADAPGEVGHGSAGEAFPPAGAVDERELAMRLAEAMAFAADRPVPSDRLQPLLPEGFVAREIFAAVAERYAGRGVELVEVAGGWAFRTAPDLAMALTRVIETPRRLPRVAMETLAIIAYHQPVTRAEIEEIRGASLSQNTLDVLLEMGLIAPRGRKEVPGRPSLWATTTRFLEQFGLKALGDLPRREELLAGEGPGLDLRGGS